MKFSLSNSYFYPTKVMDKNTLKKTYSIFLCLELLNIISYLCVGVNSGNRVYVFIEPEAFIQYITEKHSTISFQS